MTAEDRREDVLDAALVAFAAAGFEGTSTEDIARAAGISQPYLFRLFGTKKELFMEAVAWGFRDTLRAFREAVEDATDAHDAFKRMGDAYVALIADRRYLDLQLQAYASCEDPEIRAIVVRGFGALVEEILVHTQATPDQLASFLGKGMLLNVATAMGVAGKDEGWPRMLREGCVGGF